MRKLEFNKYGDAFLVTLKEEVNPITGETEQVIHRMPIEVDDKRGKVDTLLTAQEKAQVMTERAKPNAVNTKNYRDNL